MADPLTKQADGSWLNTLLYLAAPSPPPDPDPDPDPPGELVTPVGTYSDTYSDTYS